MDVEGYSVIIRNTEPMATITFAGCLASFVSDLCRIMVKRNWFPDTSANLNIADESVGLRGIERSMVAELRLKYHQWRADVRIPYHIPHGLQNTGT